MGLTPAGGVMMGTRVGDLDPGVMIFLERHGFAQADAMEDLVNRKSGLLGVSGTSSDVRQLLESRESAAADLALRMFCYQVRKTIAAMAGALGGLDLLVFTGGIGEHAEELRRRNFGELLSFSSEPVASKPTTGCRATWTRAKLAAASRLSLPAFSTSPASTRVSPRFTSSPRRRTYSHGLAGSRKCTSSLSSGLGRLSLLHDDDRASRQRRTGEQAHTGASRNCAGKRLACCGFADQKQARR